MIEIRELIIRARIDEASQSSGSAMQAPSKGMSNQDVQKIVAMCAEEVMKVIKRQMER